MAWYVKGLQTEKLFLGKLQTYPGSCVQPSTDLVQKPTAISLRYIAKLCKNYTI